MPGSPYKKLPLVLQGSLSRIYYLSTPRAGHFGISNAQGLLSGHIFCVHFAPRPGGAYCYVRGRGSCVASLLGLDSSRTANTVAVAGVLGTPINSGGYRTSWCVAGFRVSGRICYALWIANVGKNYHWRPGTWWILDL